MNVVFMDKGKIWKSKSKRNNVVTLLLLCALVIAKKLFGSQKQYLLQIISDKNNKHEHNLYILPRDHLRSCNRIYQNLPHSFCYI